MNSQVAQPGTVQINNAKTFGHLLAEQMRKDPHFYLFSPDETTSNRLSEVYELEARAWDLPTETYDLPESPTGRIVELLSENALLAALIGHLSNGEPGVMTSYEAFFSINYAQILQHLKFLRQLAQVSWRQAWPALNLLSTSMCWRQDHNGFTHQSPALLSALLAVPGARVNCLFPLDDSAVERTFEFMLQSTNVVNLVTVDKNPTPRWIDSAHADYLFHNGGASIFGFASDDAPDLILTAAGDVAVREMLRARELIKADFPAAKLRFVGINSLTPGAIGTFDRPLSQAAFDECFTTDRPILAAFHAYPEALRTILANYAAPSRLTVRGFLEEGTTTTPLEMLRLNQSSRFDLAAEIALQLNRPDLANKYRQQLAEHSRYALRHGIDSFELN